MGQVSGTRSLIAGVVLGDPERRGGAASPRTPTLSSLDGLSLALAQQRLGFGERGLVPHRREELPRLAQRLRRGLAKRGEAAALAEQGVCAQPERVTGGEYRER